MLRNSHVKPSIKDSLIICCGKYKTRTLASICFDHLDDGKQVYFIESDYMHGSRYVSKNKDVETVFVTAQSTFESNPPTGHFVLFDVQSVYFDDDGRTCSEPQFRHFERVLEWLSRNVTQDNAHNTVVAFDVALLSEADAVYWDQEAVNRIFCLIKQLYEIGTTVLIVFPKDSVDLASNKSDIRRGLMSLIPTRMVLDPGKHNVSRTTSYINKSSDGQTYWTFHTSVHSSLYWEQDFLSKFDCWRLLRRPAGWFMLVSGRNRIICPPIRLNRRIEDIECAIDAEREKILDTVKQTIRTDNAGKSK